MNFNDFKKATSSRAKPKDVANFIFGKKKKRKQKRRIFDDQLYIAIDKYGNERMISGLEYNHEPLIREWYKIKHIVK